MITARTVTLIAIVFITALFVRTFAQSQGTDNHQLPPIFDVGKQVISPLGETLTIQTVDGEWIEISPSQISTFGSSGSSGSLGSGTRWMHVPTSNIWRSVR